MTSDFRILVVEDDNSICSVLSAVLQPAFVVDSVGTQAACLEKTEKEFYDGLILDLMLPNGGGLALVSRLSEMFDTPIIVLTGRDFKREDVLRAGATEFIQKPLGVEELRDIVEKTVYHKRAIDWTRPLKKLVDEAKDLIDTHLARG